MFVVTKTGILPQAMIFFFFFYSLALTFIVVITGCADCNQSYIPHHLILGYCRTTGVQQSGLPGREPVDFKGYDHTLVLIVSADYWKHNLEHYIPFLPVKFP